MPERHAPNGRRLSIDESKHAELDRMFDEAVRRADENIKALERTLDREIRSFRVGLIVLVALALLGAFFL